MDTREEENSSSDENSSGKELGKSGRQESSGDEINVLEGLNSSSVPDKVGKDFPELASFVDGNIFKINDLHPELSTLLKDDLDRKADTGKIEVETLLDYSPDGFIVLNNGFELVFINKTAIRLLDLNQTDFEIGKPLKVIDLKKPSLEITTDGETRIIEPRWNLVTKNEKTFVVITLRNTTETVKLINRLKKKSVTDELTGLLNRRGFFYIGRHLLEQALREKRAVQVIVVDLNGLKAINDKLGHPVGDQAIINTSLALKETMRTSDLVARIGGDEFALLTSSPKYQQANRLIERIEENIEKFNKSGNAPYTLSLSCGCSDYDPINPVSLEKLYEIADLEMYKAKAAYKRRCKNTRN